VKLTNKYGLPPAFVHAVTSLVHDISAADPKRIGVTTLINPPRMRVLTARHWDELEEDVSDHIWRISGTAMHWVLEKMEHPDRLVEKKIEEEIDGVTLVGKLDLYEKPIESIEDWKQTSIWSIKIEEKEEWTAQLNCYAYFLERAGYPVRQANINAIIRDWRRGESMKYDDYPPIPFVRKSIKLWSREEQEKYIKDRIKEYKIALQLEDDELPECSEKDRWHKDDKYAVYRNTNTTATKILETAKDAEDYITYCKSKEKKPSTYRIDKREGDDFRCQNYCSCNSVCSQYLKKYGAKPCQKSVLQ
jgi:hypothetical protein